jgi:hypothetical protein
MAAISLFLYENHGFSLEMKRFDGVDSALNIP